MCFAPGPAFTGNMGLPWSHGSQWKANSQHSFQYSPKIPPAMAIQIFYSARSFNGRIDIFDAALTASEASDEAKSFARALIKKAKKYSEYRNKFAHDQPLLHQYGSPAKFRVLMVDGKGQFQSDEVKK